MADFSKTLELTPVQAQQALQAGGEIIFGFWGELLPRYIFNAGFKSQHE